MGVRFHKVFNYQRLVTEMVSHRKGPINRAPFVLHLMGLLALALMLSITTRAQGNQTATSQFGRIMSTVTDMHGDGIAGVTVALTGPDPSDRRTTETDQNGFFQFDAVKPGMPHQVSVSASGFEEWSSSTITLDPGQVKLLDTIELRILTKHTTVEVTYQPEHVATQQVKLEEKQRILGIIPNFHITYKGDNTAPLTAKLKFQLALKVSYDPVTIAGVALTAGLRQAANSPNYPQGAKGYGERFGATAADGFSDIMIGGAILPSLLHQDPRYFYQGTGTTKSRIRHAMLSPFVAKGDNGKWEPNYSSVGGDLASAALSNLYFPKSNRGAGLVFSQFALGTAERVGASLAQEFLLGKLTHRGGHIN
jgi:hypothetical protein